jgi:hypothetical protein
MFDAAAKSLKLVELIENIRATVVDPKIASLVKRAEDLACDLHEHHTSTNQMAVPLQR